MDNKSYSFLLRAWTEPHRHFHNLQNHLIPLLDKISDSPWADHSFYYQHDRLVAAAWWHDAVYVIGAKDNEERSAEVFRQYAGVTEDYSDIFIDKTTKIILATKDHQPTGDEEIDWFIRADLGPLLTGDTDALRWGEHLIWKEFGSRYSPEQYVAGRIKFLEGMLEHPFQQAQWGVEWNIDYVARRGFLQNGVTAVIL